MAETVQLFVVIALLRPFVYIFLVFYLTAVTAAAEWRQTALFTGIAWVAAFSAEYSSIRNDTLWFLETIYEYPEPGPYFVLYIPMIWMICRRCRQWSALRGLISREAFS